MSLRPDFDNLLAVLDGQVPARATLFELFLNQPLYEKLAGKEVAAKAGPCKWGDVNEVVVAAFANGGYDYATCYGSDLAFDFGQYDKRDTMSLNTAGLIGDRGSFESYAWPDPEGFDYSRLQRAGSILPDGMKLVVLGPGGVLENAVFLMGFDRLCMMLVDDPELIGKVFNAIGKRLLKYYEICASFDSVGALICNDDWGFKTQTMLSPGDLRRYVFPWNRRIVEAIHASGKPAILHSCGYAEEIMDDIIDEMKFDAKHSYEDSIEPVEEAYERWGSRIAVLGGIDVDFICRSTPQQVRQRCSSMLLRTAERGGYALGTGNSVPEYVPYAGFRAMIETAIQSRG